MAHSVLDKLMGSEGAWVPVHREIARAGRHMCSSVSEMAVWSIVLEMWQDQQSARTARELSDRVEISLRELTREMQRGEPKSRTTARRIMERLVRNGVLEDTGERSSMGQRILSLRPVIEAVSGSTGTAAHPGAERDPRGAKRGLSLNPGGVSTGTRYGSQPEPGTGLNWTPHSRETSPSYSEGEERSESPAVAGRAGPVAQPTPALEQSAAKRLVTAWAQQTLDGKPPAHLRDRAERIVASEDGGHGDGTAGGWSRHASWIALSDPGGWRRAQQDGRSDRRQA